LLKKIFPTTLIIILIFLCNISASAKTIKVRMLNKGETGSMIFEPSFISVEIGDTIIFQSTDKGHNVQNIKGMLPEGVKSFKSKINDDYSFVPKKEGLYGLKCTPHYGMGMVALVQVGKPLNLQKTRSKRHPGKAKKRFADLFDKIKN